MRKFTLVAGLAMLAGAATAMAQPPSGQWWVIHEEVARPSQLALYESSAKDFKAMVEANKASMPTFQFHVLQGDDFHYLYAAPVKNFAALDTINGEFGALMQATGGKFGELMTRAAPATESYSEAVFGNEPSMGYKPANPPVKIEDAGYFRFSFYYLEFGKEQEATAIAKDFAALFQSKGLGNGFNIYWAVNGPDLPLLAVQEWAKDEADFLATAAKIDALVAKEIKPLNERALAITRRLEVKSYWPRPDLSSWPAPAKK